MVSVPPAATSMVFAPAVGQLLAIQIERNFIVRFHFQSTTGQRNIALKDIVPCVNVVVLAVI